MNVLDGGLGNDNIIGAPDSTAGYWTVEWLVGGADNDILQGGGAGQNRNYDFFAPGDGNDTMKGGAGSQVFYLSGTTGKAEGTDVIDNAGLDPANNTIDVSYSNRIPENVNPYYETFPESVATTEASRANSVQISRDGVANDGELGEGDSIPVNVNGVIGGSGDDTLGSAAEVFQFINGEGGKDTLSYGMEMFGGYGDDTITANSAGSKINGEGKNDTLIGGAGQDTIDGGEGADSINGGGENDILLDYSPFGDSSDNTVIAGAGSDTVRMNSDGTNTVYGNSGNDRVTANNGVAKLYGGDDDDTLNSGSSNDTLDGGSGNNTLDAGDGKNTITAAGGNDTIDTGSGEDIVDAGDGNNQLTDTGGTNRLVTGSGNDTVTGGRGSDTITTGGSDDVLTPGLGDDVVDAGDGNNQLTDTGGSDRFVSGSGNDTVTLTGSASTDRDAYQTGDGADTVVDKKDSSFGRELLGRVDVDSSGQDDTVQLTSASLDSHVSAGSGNDTIKAHNASGGDGDDLLQQTMENENGGSGSLSGDAGNDQLLSSDFATCYRTNYEDKYVSDALNGGSGNDRLVGGGGSDTLLGGDGDDELIGGHLVSCKGDPLASTTAQFDDSAGYIDTLNGESGNDTLNGSTDDQIQGGDDNDRIILDAAYVYGDSGSGAPGPSLNAQGDIYGGAGTDTVDYSKGENLYRDLQVSLDDLANDGQKIGSSNRGYIAIPTQYVHNTHSDVENIVGNRGDDLLIGSVAANSIDGGGGTNVIVGGAGPDVLSGGIGYGAGYIYARDGEHDEIKCKEHGPYGDAEVDSRDVVSNCNKVNIDDVGGKSKDKPSCKVVNTVGADVAQAKKTLSDNRCRPIVSAWWWVTSRKISGKVHKQSLWPSEYQENSQVLLTVTRKTTKKWCSIPALLGKNSSTVERAFRKIQCNVTYRYKRVKSKHKVGRVLVQSAKGKIRSARTINVTIGSKR